MLAEARKNCLGSEPELPLKSFGLVALGGGGGEGGALYLGSVKTSHLPLL